MARTRRVMTVAGVASGIVAALALTAGPANAVAAWGSTTQGEGDGFFENWPNRENYPDQAGAIDRKKDGMSVAIRWTSSSGTTGECVDKNGANNGTTLCTVTGLNQRGTVTFKVCARDYSNDIGWINCSRPDSHPLTP
ncbi:hypothetical protein J7F01_36760 [Streptomyces sp. ISL-22]|uniref:hypothetical protein n=1 Tax=unclassified Streptomyces TaxID=2593676 RepID=UPI001BE71C14|nr:MULTISPECIES: hypothetical protein [unclassified Streptomyces]MBT2422577.1 hypothetical protein [Streptomyces sp. ISL-24]MBT2437606.1 hypothetical protein [Streptomyces sp. ISL-22]